MVSGSHLRRRGALTLLLAVLVLVGLAAGPVGADSLRQESERDVSGVEAGARDVIVIGAPGLSWKDVTEEQAPAITSFAAGAAVANLNVRSTYFTSCPTDGWLGLSAGTRAAEPRDVTRGELRSDPRALPHCSPLPTLPDPGPELMAVEMDHGYWQDLAKGVAAQGFDARIGTLASTVHEAGGCIDGSGAGAVLAMADRDGVVRSGDPGVNETCAITLVGAPAITVPSSRSLRSDEGASKGSSQDTVRTRQVEAVDDVVADVVAGAHSDTVVVLAGLSDDGGQPGLRVLAMGGAGIPSGWLHSDSTTRDEMGQVADVTHTALATAGFTPPPGLAGRQLVPVDDGAPFADRLATLVDDDAQLQEADRVIPPFFRGFGFGLVGLLALPLVLLRVGPRRWRPVVPRAAGLVGLAAMAVPASTYLLTTTRWFDSDHPMGAFVLRLAVIDLALLALTLAAVLAVLRRARPRWLAEGPAVALVGVAVLSAVTWLLLAGDLLVGRGRMTMLSVLGLLPLDGGRFHGFGNVPFAIFVAAAFLLMAALVAPTLHDPRVMQSSSDRTLQDPRVLQSSGRAPAAEAAPFGTKGARRTAALVVAVVGGATFVVDAWLGADGGGALALIPSVGYLVLAVAGVRLTWTRVVGIGVVTGVGFLAMAGADWLRPEEQRTHLGRFFQSLLDGDAWGILVRKLETNVDLLLGPERTALLVPVVLVVVIWVLARPSSAAGQRVQPLMATYPGLRVGLIGLVVALTVGFLLNDSGTAIPAAAALVLAPALLVLWAGVGRARDERVEGSATG
ncbi:hypothetical protein NMQ01_00375 [Janibacter sp. CX7]|uniref:hypothetical protein n=1 Tax=Janibacter sp. CX7 TaxID=2963431 RepID=UPI0020CBF19A|nr:hypothetical protein [Janibacter sp. CX7]UTT66209.1 hypothetical protein NMQ01_00375 [Janibacter sp. CX7]